MNSTIQTPIGHHPADKQLLARLSQPRGILARFRAWLTARREKKIMRLRDTIRNINGHIEAMVMLGYDSSTLHLANIIRERDFYVRKLSKLLQNQ